MAKHLLIWIIVTLVSIVLLPGMLAPQTYLAKITDDQRHLSGEIGKQSASIIIATTDRIYNELFEDSGFHPWVKKHYEKGTEHRNELLAETPSDKLSKFAGAYLGAFFVSMYEMIFRFTQIGYWAAFALPFIIAAAFDGLMVRKVRNVTFNYSSPAKYNAIWHFIIVLFSGTVFYCNTPLPMPAAIFPLLVFAAAMGIRGLLANLQRSA